MTSIMESRGGMLMTMIGLIILVVTGLLFFARSAVLLATGLAGEGEVIEFNKGDMYMFGSALAVIFLLAGAAPNVFLGRKLTAYRERTLIRGALAGLIIMVALPQLAHLAVWAKVRDEPYLICGNLGYEWLFYKKVVYTSSEEKCFKLVIERGQ